MKNSPFISRLELYFDLNSTFLGYVAISSVFIFSAFVMLISGYMPTHDAISWHGVFHYFYSSIEKGVFPYWNPYSQTGTPFYVYCQSFGLLEPSNFLFILGQKITGCSTLTTYVLHYFFYFFIFIIGTYHLLRIITGNNSISLLFSLILLFSCFPMFMRQNGALNSFFLVPSITVFLLLFFKESSKNKKSLYFFTACYLFAVTLNVYIPAGSIFYLLIFLTFVFIFKIARIKETVEFIKKRYGLLLLTAVVIILISLPVLALYDDFHNDNEMFPSIRILQKNGSNLVKLYTADIEENFFSEKLTNNLKTSNNLWNMLGLILEPLVQLTGDPEVLTSEVFMYVSILPLLAGIIALKMRNRYVYLFWTIMALTFFTMMNFKKEVISTPTLFQEIIITIMPFLRTLEVLQNFGPLFLFCLVVIGAIGLSKAEKFSRNNIIWTSSMGIVALKNIFLFSYLYLIAKYQVSLFEWFYVKLRGFYLSVKPVLGNMIPSAFISYLPSVLLVTVLAVIVFFLPIGLLFYRFSDKIKSESFRKIAIILMMTDLIIFAFFHTTHFFIPPVQQ